MQVYNTEYIWDLLEEEAQKTNCQKRTVACIIYDTVTKEVLSTGHNYHKDGICDCTTTRTAVHAEQSAVLNLTEKRLKNQLIAFVNHIPCNNCISVLNKVVGEVRYKSQK